MQISNFPNNGKVWEISNPTTPRLVSGTLSGSTYSFKVNADSLRSFIAFEGTNFKVPTFVGRVAHQDLHGLSQDRKSTRLNSSHVRISYAVFCLKKKKEVGAQDALKKQRAYAFLSCI